MKKYLQVFATGLLLLFFILGAMNQSINFGGKIGQPYNTQIWHGFYLSLCLLSLFCVLSARELGYYWLLTIFIWQIPVELKGSIMTLQSVNPNFEQAIEPLLNLVGLGCLLLTKSRYFSKSKSSQ